MLFDTLEMGYFEKSIDDSPSAVKNAQGEWLAGRGSPLGSVNLKTAYKISAMPDGGKIGFYIFTQDRQWEFYSDSLEDRKTWMDMYVCRSW